MRVLWFADSPSLYKSKSDINYQTYYGVGWVSSLEEEIVKSDEIEFGLCFFHLTDDAKVKQGKATYYPVLENKGSYFKRFYNNWKGKTDKPESLQRLLDVIEDFKPDVIQVFGTESYFGMIQFHTKVPVVIHIQCICNSWLNAWYPPGISARDTVIKEKNWLNILKGHSNWFHRKRFAKQALREDAYFPVTKNLMGRTAWDRGITSLLMPQAKYFSVNEMLRPIFYKVAPWQSKQRTKTKIITTISSSSYKGLDLILKTAHALKKYTSFDFEWFVCGVKATDHYAYLMERKFKLKYADNNVTFLGANPPEKLVDLLLDADVYVHPSYIETSSISIAEAQILGMPVICCYAGGLTTLVENNKTGLLIPTNDPFDLAHKIVYLSQNKTEAETLGKNARLAAVKRHDKATITSDVMNAYHQIISTK